MGLSINKVFQNKHVISCSITVDKSNLFFTLNITFLQELHQSVIENFIKQFTNTTTNCYSSVI